MIYWMPGTQIASYIQVKRKRISRIEKRITQGQIQTIMAIAPAAINGITDVLNKVEGIIGQDKQVSDI